MAAELRGTEILGYRLEECIGEGGMASVWRAEHLSIRKTVAIKVLDALLARDAKLVERFRIEAEVQHRLRHPNIVLVENYSFDLLAMVMEYVEGRTLSEMIGREVGPIPLERALPLMRQILGAVEYAHRQGIIHRDLKPSNVLVTRDGALKVMDFGIAKVVGGSKLTRTGSVMGTIAYMSPEQIKGAQAVDPRSDIYSLGVTFYEMLAGRTPFEGSGADYADNDYLVRKGHVELPPPDPRQFYPSIPGPVVEVLMQALAKDPALRFPDAEHMGLALDDAVGETKPQIVAGSIRVEPTSEGKTSPAAAPPTRSRALMALGATVLFGIIVAVTFAVISTSRSQATLQDRLEAAQGELASSKVTLAATKAERDRLRRENARLRARITSLTKRTSPRTTVSSKAKVLVPKVMGVRLRFARPRLVAKGLTLGRVSYSEDEDHMEGMVLGQNPGPGTMVSAGSKVDLVVNRWEE